MNEKVEALFKAVENSNITVLEGLLKKPAYLKLMNEKMKKCTLLYWAAYSSNPKNMDVIACLLKHKADPLIPSLLGKSLITHYFASRGLTEELESLKALLPTNTFSKMINTKSGLQFTALTHAVLNQQLETTKWLLKNQANPNIGDGGKMTPLHYASSEINTENMQAILIAYGSDTKALDHLNRTPYQRYQDVQQGVVYDEQGKKLAASKPKLSASH